MINPKDPDWETKLLTQALEGDVPVGTASQIVDYVAHGVPLGSFLKAVMLNDLVESYKFADVINTAHMREIVRFLYQYCPMSCHGSQDIYYQWIDQGGIEGNEYTS